MRFAVGKILGTGMEQMARQSKKFEGVADERKQGCSTLRQAAG